MDAAPDKPPQDTSPEKSKTRIITAELALLLYVLYFAPNLLISEQYIFSEVSKEYNYTAKDANRSECQSENSNITLLQQKVQGKSSHVMLVLGLSSSIPSIISTIILGAFSDGKGRKISLLIPLGGALMRCTVYAIVIGLNLPYWYLVIGAVIDGLSGCLTSFLMSCFAYIADISSTEKRTVRITILEVIIGVAIAGSMFASGYMIQAIGYMYSFIILFAINIVNIVYIVFVLPETRTNRERSENLTIRKVLSSSATVYLVDDHTKRRWKLQLVTMILVVTGMVSLSKTDTQTYFLKGRPLCFSPVQVGYFTGGFSLAQNLGTLFAVVMFGSKLGDIGILIIGCVCGTVEMVYFTFVKNIWMVSLVPVIGMFALTVVPMVRSIGSKLTHANEQGAMFAVIAVAEACSNAIGTSVLNAVYPATLHIMPGFIFIFMASIYVIGFIMACVKVYFTRKEEIGKAKRLLIAD